MPLNNSGPISLAGSTAGQSIALELGQSATGQISLNATNVRTLAGKPTGAVVMPIDFYGKSTAYPYIAIYSSSTANPILNNTLNGYRYYDASENALYFSSVTGTFSVPNQSAVLTKINATTGQIIWQNVYQNTATNGIAFGAINQAKSSNNLVILTSINGIVSGSTFGRTGVMVIAKSDGTAIASNVPVSSATNRVYPPDGNILYDSTSNTYIYGSGSTSGTDTYNWINQVNADTLAFIRCIRGSTDGTGWQNGYNFGLNNNSQNYYYTFTRPDGINTGGFLRYNPSTATYISQYIVNGRVTIGGMPDVSSDGTRFASTFSVAAPATNLNVAGYTVQTFNTDLTVRWVRLTSTSGIIIGNVGTIIDSSYNVYASFRDTLGTHDNICKFDANGNLLSITRFVISGSSLSQLNVFGQDNDYLYLIMNGPSPNNANSLLIKYPKTMTLYGTFTIQGVTLVISNAAGTITFSNATFNTTGSYTAFTSTSVLATLTGATNRTTGTSSLVQQLNI